MSDRASNPVLVVLKKIVEASLEPKKLAEVIAEYRKFEHLGSDKNRAEIDAFLEEHGL